MFAKSAGGTVGGNMLHASQVGRNCGKILTMLYPVLVVEDDPKTANAPEEEGEAIAAPFGFLTERVSDVRIPSRLFTTSLSG
jgi:hypothetical protein